MLMLRNLVFWTRRISGREEAEVVAAAVLVVAVVEWIVEDGRWASTSLLLRSAVGAVPAPATFVTSPRAWAA